MKLPPLLPQKRKNKEFFLKDIQRLAFAGLFFVFYFPKFDGHGL